MFHRKCIVDSLIAYILLQEMSSEGGESCFEKRVALKIGLSKNTFSRLMCVTERKRKFMLLTFF